MRPRDYLTPKQRSDYAAYNKARKRREQPTEDQFMASNLYQQARYRCDPRQKKNAQRRWQFGLSPEKFEALMRKQAHCCGNPGCRAPLKGNRSTHVDHDRKCCGRGKTCGKCVRGLLCHLCNLMLGHAKDNPERLLGAVQYLLAHQHPEA